MFLVEILINCQVNFTPIFSVFFLMAKFFTGGGLNALGKLNSCKLNADAFKNVYGLLEKLSVCLSLNIIFPMI